MKPAFIVPWEGRPEARTHHGGADHGIPPRVDEEDISRRPLFSAEIPRRLDKMCDLAFRSGFHHSNLIGSEVAYTVVLVEM